jgi:hypothetical protein
MSTQDAVYFESDAMRVVLCRVVKK